MTLTVQKSLFDAGGGTSTIEAARWMERVMLGHIALGLCVIAVALIGALMLSGRLPLREGMRVLIGCFVLLGAPIIGSGLMQDRSGRDDNSPSRSQNSAETAVPRGDMPPANYDPYAGASLGQN